MTYLDNLVNKLAKRFNTDPDNLGRNLATLIHALIIIVPVMAPLGLSVEVSTYTQLCFDAIESLQPGDYIFLDIGGVNDSNFQAEVGWRGIAMFNHLNERGIKIIIVTGGSGNRQQQSVRAFPMFWEFFDHWQLGLPNPVANPKYGRDWVFMRAFPLGIDWQLRFISDGWDVSSFPEMRFDDGGNDVTQMPIYWKDGIIGGERAVQNLYDIKAYIDIEGPPSGARRNWKIGLPYPELILLFGGPVQMGLQQRQYVPDIYEGFIVGLRGAGEYESLSSGKYGSHLAGPASTSLDSVSIGLLWYCGTVVLININAYLRRKEVS